MSKIIDLDTKRKTRIDIDNEFGLCPVCYSTPIFRNVGSVHFACCDRDRVCWSVGSNLFSAWREQSENIWQENERLLLTYKRVDPAYGNEPDAPAWMRQILREPNTKIPTMPISADNLEVTTMSKATMTINPKIPTDPNIVTDPKVRQRRLDDESKKPLRYFQQFDGFTACDGVVEDCGNGCGAMGGSVLEFFNGGWGIRVLVPMNTSREDAVKMLKNISDCIEHTERWPLHERRLPSGPKEVDGGEFEYPF